MDSSKEDEWNSLTSIKDIFPIYGTGIKTNRDNFVIDLDKSALMNRMNDFFDINHRDASFIYSFLSVINSSQAGVALLAYSLANLSDSTT